MKRFCFGEHKNKLLAVFFLLSTIYPVPLWAQEDIAPQDSLTQTTDTTKTKQNFIKKVINYFSKANKPDDYRKFNFGLLPGPHYSSTEGLGLGIIATGTYSMDRTDSILPLSNVTIFADFTTIGKVNIGVRGTNIFKKEKYRLDYKVKTEFCPTDFWGIGYDAADIDENKASYKNIQVEAMARFMFRIAPKTYLGPVANFKYMAAKSISAKEAPRFEGLDRKVNTNSLGVSFTYDSRDFMLNAYKGVFIQLDQNFTPKFLANDYTFMTTELTGAAYTKMWKGAVLATELHTQLNYDGTPPWCLLSEVGSSYRMRGYYDGRYRDNNIVEAQLELRQNIKGRHGMVAWIGAAQIFPEWKKWDNKKILPNAGIGYRWEFMKRVNVRIDYGFTRNGGGLIFNINEAF